MVLGREKEGIPVDIIHMLDACIEIPQLGVVRSLNVHVSGAIALWEYTRQQRCRQPFVFEHDEYLSALNKEQTELKMLGGIAE